MHMLAAVLVKNPVLFYPRRGTVNVQFDMASVALELHILSFCQQEQKRRGLGWQMSPTLYLRS